jgi:predicted exporter
VALKLIIATYVLISVLLSRRYGWMGAVETLFPVLGGAVVCVALLGWAGVPLNLFHVLGLLLVLGMGSDYTIFLRESRNAPAPALLAVTLATLTAVLSFGLLAFSSISFIHAIGLVEALGLLLVVGIAIALRPLEQ